MSDPYSHLTRQIRDDGAELARLRAENEMLRGALEAMMDGADCSDYGEAGIDHPQDIIHMGGGPCPVCLGREALATTAPEAT